MDVGEFVFDPLNWATSGQKGAPETKEVEIMIIEPDDHKRRIRLLKCASLPHPANRPASRYMDQGHDMARRRTGHFVA